MYPLQAQRSLVQRAAIAKPFVLLLLLVPGSLHVAQHLPRSRMDGKHSSMRARATIAPPAARCLADMLPCAVRAVRQIMIDTAEKKGVSWKANVAELERSEVRQRERLLLPKWGGARCSGRSGRPGAARWGLYSPHFVRRALFAALCSLLVRQNALLQPPCPAPALKSHPPSFPYKSSRTALNPPPTNKPALCK